MVNIYIYTYIYMFIYYMDNKINVDPQTPWFWSPKNKSPDSKVGVRQDVFEHRGRCHFDSQGAQLNGVEKTRAMGLEVYTP